LSSLLECQNLDDIDDEFSPDEIPLVIKNLPNNNALGPDGFNGYFIKKCWGLLRNSFLGCLMILTAPPWISVASMPLT